MNAYEFIVKLKNYASSELRKVAKDAGIADKETDKFNNRLKKTDSISKGLSSSLGGLKGKLIGLFAGASLFAFTNQVIEARAEYEKFDAVLTNTFQNKDVGQGALAMLTDFAAKTPYQLNELTGSFIKLANRGIAPSYLEMTKLGDLASSQGKSFDQLTEAIMDAQTGEFERMKEFGIRASKNGDKVALTFKGVTKEVQMNDRAIKDAILTYGDMAGVAGSMDVISKTLGGRISNIKDQWWGFLVAIGGYGGGIIGDFLDLAGQGLMFLQAHLPQIAHWFNMLWTYLSPVVIAIKDFVQASFGISGTSDLLNTFGNVMAGVLLIVNWLSTGIITLLDWLRPIAPILGGIAIGWAILNALFAVTPIGWIVIGITALILVIGMLIKYTDGWGKSWKAIGNLIKLWWLQVKADFRMGVDIAIYQFNRLRYSAFEIFDKIGQKIANVGKAVKRALKFDFTGAYDTLNKEVTSRYTKKLKDNEAEFQKNAKTFLSETAGRVKQAKKEVGDIGITVDTQGISNDFAKIKKSFSGLKPEQKGDASAYTDFLNKNNVPKGAGMSATGNGKSTKDKDSKDGIVSGGSKQTNIQITIGKLQDQTVIHVSNTEKGISNLGDKIQEELLRAVNSINQMQTG